MFHGHEVVNYHLYSTLIDGAFSSNLLRHPGNGGFLLDDEKKSSNAWRHCNSDRFLDSLFPLNSFSTVKKEFSGKNRQTGTSSSCEYLGGSMNTGNATMDELD